MRFACVRLDTDSLAPRLCEDVLIQIGESVSPRFEWDGDAHLYLDVGSPLDEAQCGDRIHQRFLAEKLACRVAIASSKKLAQLAVLTGRPCIPSGTEKAFLDPLPIDLLAPPVKLREKLMRWGIATLGALARLPNGKVATLLGGEGWTLQQAARGIDLLPFTPYRRTATFSKTLHLEWPILEIAPFLFAAQDMLERLILELAAMDTACRLLNVHLRLDPSGDDDRSIRLRSPTREIKTLLELLAREMRSRPPKAPITQIEIVLHPDHARDMQLSLFGPPAFSPARLATTLAQLYALMGPERVGSPLVTDGIRPERWRLAAYEAPPPPLLREALPSATPPWTAIRVLRPPVLLHASCAADWPHRPLHLQSFSKGLSVNARVLVASGPWKIEERWWADAPTARAYWTVELESGWILRIYSDAHHAWYADGLYD